VAASVDNRQEEREARVERFGVLEQNIPRDDTDVHVEELRLRGYTVLDPGFDSARLDRLANRFDEIRAAYNRRFLEAGFDLAAIGEGEVVRAPLVFAEEFLALALDPRLHALLERVLGEYYILNQSNGLINPSKMGAYSQRPYHRDLPFRHVVLSRPIAINALFALDEFTVENGATRVIPGSHHMEAFPSDAAIRRLEQPAEVQRGHFLVLDGMTFHAGGLNTTDRDRRAVNHLFTIPAMRQQLHVPSLLGAAKQLEHRARRILGYGLDEFRSHGDWFRSRQAKQDQKRGAPS
jgi:ectoine hydroxylase-related dioxygenase (phytanoyl-CoA dioxygenase family)